MAKTLDVTAFSQRKTTLSYPNIFLGQVDISSAIVISMLEEGDMPVIGENNGEKRILKRISSSAYNIDKLLRIHGHVKYNKSEGQTVELTKITDYLEVIDWTY